MYTSYNHIRQFFYFWPACPLALPGINCALVHAESMGAAVCAVHTRAGDSCKVS